MPDFNGKPDVKAGARAPLRAHKVGMRDCHGRENKRGGIVASNFFAGVCLGVRMRLFQGRKTAYEGNSKQN